ncbi:MAG: aminomethyl-transferring glycine dehydrogenase subunit GcvPA, partial [Candidatus Binatia bacterium]
AKSIDELFSAIPESLYGNAELKLERSLGERSLMELFGALAERNRSCERNASFLGGGAYHHFIPAAVAALAGRGEFLTAYTPYQAEVSQGTLQAIFEFQTLVSSLFGLEVANASMYDGASATAEAVLMSKRLAPKAGRVLLASSLPPPYRRVVATYLAGLPGLEAVELAYGADGRIDRAALDRQLDPAPTALVVASPNAFGVIEDLTSLAERLHAAGSFLVSVTPEALSLGILKSPGSCGADIAVAEGQSFGLALSFGGPYLGLFATREKFVRSMPGRLVSETVDGGGRRGFVLTLATREQHIRRERATSNICTNQGLMALAATTYLALAGRRGLREIAEQNAAKARYAQKLLVEHAGATPVFSAPFFNEFAVRLPDARKRRERALDAGILAGLPLGDWYP